ncbi:gem-associated protein 4 [Bufo bufo]|uniref:gem-associated protein 4 n=1 Tax=Bufo bufo TaxID=8384 RepID=UPI001ABE450F|nr:gem-associated protein 4 [Bufo bufo]XP_040280716.1 gem-associated protein 4 [Bufo bufo]XP_040280717.1 gem-associated protein 4 [Bufo bufo]
MEVGSWNICEQTVVLQGALLLAEKLTLQKTLLKLTKAEWPLVEKTIINALQEISSGTWSQSLEWRRKVIAIFWAKVLSCQAQLSLDGDFDIDRRWKEEEFFPVENMIPKMNHTLLFEVLKAAKAADVFAELLLALPADFWVSEASLLLNHICDDTSIADVTFFLDVWWEIMKNSRNRKDEIIETFSAVACQYLPKTKDEIGQSSKRFKPDPEQCLPAADNILAVFLEGLHKLRPSINNSKLKCYTIANLADMLCSSAFLDKESGDLPIRLYLEKLVAVLCFCNATVKDDNPQKSLPEMIQEAERIVQSGNSASRFRLLGGAQHFGLKCLKDLLFHWGEELHNYMNNCEKISYECFRMNGSLASLQKNLVALEPSETFSEEQKGNALELANCISSLLEKTSNVQITCKMNDVDMMATVAKNIIDSKMCRYKEICFEYASEIAWAFSSDWLNCLKRNKQSFQEPDLILKLLETVSKATYEQNNQSITEIQKSTAVILDLFSELSLAQMDELLMRALNTWGEKGLSHCMSAFTDNFQEELNMTFNQISQNVTDYNNVSRVARLALLYPEYVISKACHFAVSNLGAHVFLAKILTSLPALSFRGSNNSDTSGSLLSRCLMETCWGKLSSDKEENQFLYLLCYLMNPSETTGESVSLLRPAEVVRTFVLPYILDECVHVELCLNILHKALNVENPLDVSDKHWVLSCSPFPLIMSLCKLLNSFSRCWQQSDKPYCLTLGSKELIVEILTQLCPLILPVAETSPETWGKSLFWLHRKMEHLDWVVRLRLKPLFGEHFKNEAPASLFAVCKLSENDWAALDLPEYGPGTGLMAWVECCCISGEMKELMLSILCVNMEDPDEVNLFSKGFLVAMVQVLPWCSSTECKLLSQVVMCLLKRQLLHVPYSLEYVEYMPLLNLRPFAYVLQFSVLLLRGFQLLCSSSCSSWLTFDGQKHIARLYSVCVSDMLDGVKEQLVEDSLQMQKVEKESDCVQEVLFIYSQVFCHVLHIIAMMPENTCAPLFFLSLEILSLYESLRANDTSKNRLLRLANERHFLKSIIENVSNESHRATLMQKINKL